MSSSGASSEERSYRQSFLDRFSHLLEQTGTDCLAWTLFDNHAHFLPRTGQSSTLARFMRRLLTGHATTFNLRHGRGGLLFQNRYNSIVCEEEPYLLELVRYIPLNPLRAGLIPDMEALGRYPWCGHGVLLGERLVRGQVIGEILQLFSNDVPRARQLYRQFVADSLAQGHREELLRRVANLFDLHGEILRQRKRSRPVAEARSLFCYFAVREMGMSGEAGGWILNISRATVSFAAGRGEVLASEDPTLRERIATPDARVGIGRLGVVDLTTWLPPC